MIRRGRAAVVAVVALAAVSTACGLGEKQEQAELIQAAHAAVVDKGTATGVLRFEIAPDRPNYAPPETVLGEPIPVDEAAIAFDVPIEIDFAAGLAVVAPPEVPGSLEPRLAALRQAAQGGSEDGDAGEGGDAASLLGELGGSTDESESPDSESPDSESAETADLVTDAGPLAIFDDYTVYAKRAGLRGTERRVWARLDYRQLPDDESTPDVDEESVEQFRQFFMMAPTVTLNPRFLFDLVQGTLAGSVNRLGPETVAGVRTVKYEVNISREKVGRELDLDEDETETREQIFRLLGITSDLHRAQYWLDDDGLLRRVRYEFNRPLRRDESFTYNVSLELDDYGSKLSAERPHNDVAVGVQRYGRLLRATFATRPR